MTGFSICFRFSGATSQAWTPDADYTLSSITKSNTSQAAMISTDPTLTTAFTSVASTDRFMDVQVFMQASSPVIQFLNTTFFGGRTYTVSASGQATICLYLTTAETSHVTLADQAELQLT